MCWLLRQPWVQLGLFLIRSAIAADDRRALRAPPLPVRCPEESRFSTCAGASPPRGGRTRRRSTTGRRACSSQNCRSSCATGARTTTGARSRRSSMPCRSSSPTIDGLDIHFIHVRSRHPNALPLIMTHGWPGSVSSSSRSSVRSPTPRPMADAPRTRSTSSCPRCRVTASPASRRARAGIPTASRAPGRS